MQCVRPATSGSLMAWSSVMSSSQRKLLGAWADSIEAAAAVEIDHRIAAAMDEKNRPGRDFERRRRRAKNRKDRLRSACTPTEARSARPATGAAGRDRFARRTTAEVIETVVATEDSQAHRMPALPERVRRRRRAGPRRRYRCRRRRFGGWPRVGIAQPAHRSQHVPPLVIAEGNDLAVALAMPAKIEAQNVVPVSREIFGEDEIARLRRRASRGRSEAFAGPSLDWDIVCPEARGPESTSPRCPGRRWIAKETRCRAKIEPK